MYVTVFTFACHPAFTGRTTPGLMTFMDTSLRQATVSIEDETHIIDVDPRDCLETIREIVHLNDGCVRIECDVELDHLRFVQFRLTVDSAKLVDCLQTSGFPSEEHVINLARSVWREARVDVPTPVESVGEEQEVSTPRWNAAYPLFAHQARTLSWMRRHERAFPTRIRYDGNLQLVPGWYIDTECECITNDASPREAILKGGLCANEPGSGKTAIALRMISEDSVVYTEPYTSRATLIILPINLISQWLHEIQKFLVGVRVLSMVRSQDMRSVTMGQLCTEYDIVLTTFSFLRSCKGYTDMVDSVLHGRPRARATLSSWARQPDHNEPLLEAVRWHRIIVDEIHETFDNPKDMRMLTLFSMRCLWGLSGTPVLDTEQAQSLYALLGREKSHHPNLLSTLISHAVRCERSSCDHGGHSQHLQLVNLSMEERLHVRRVNDVEEEVRLSSFVDAVPEDVDVGADVENTFRHMRDEQRGTLVASVASYERTMDILGETMERLKQDIDTNTDVNDPCQRARAHIAHNAYDTTEQDLIRQRALRDAEQSKLTRFDETVQSMHDRLNAIGVCVVCQKNKCDRIPSCGHAVCDSCRGSPLSDTKCQVCGRVVTSNGVWGIGTKMRQIGHLLVAHAHESVILFVQWKSMMRGMRGFLRGIGLRTLILDGNSSHRAATLTEFLSGGVLILCLEDCFAGLHLAHVRTIVFAHAIVGENDMVQRLERQAIARCVRHGQESTVRVYSFVVADSAEEQLWNETHRLSP